jgi:DNA-binding NarL/FixJ family response regulator
MLVDDHGVVRQGLKTLLDRRPGLSVVGEAGSVAEAIAEARRCRPEVIIMDVRLPDGSGIEACRAIRAENFAARVILLTSFSPTEAVLAAILAGASGFVLKQTRARALVDSIAVVADGGSLLDPEVAALTVARLNAAAAGALPEQEWQLALLTDKERRILPLIAAGKTNEEIAVTLAVPNQEVKNNILTLFGKLGLSGRA